MLGGLGCDGCSSCVVVAKIVELDVYYYWYRVGGGLGGVLEGRYAWVGCRYLVFLGGGRLCSRLLSPLGSHRCLRLGA